MGPLPKSFAADAHDCIVVRSLRTYRIQGCGAMIRARWQSSPSDHRPDHDQRGRRAQASQGAASRWPSSGGNGRNGSSLCGISKSRNSTKMIFLCSPSKLNVLAMRAPHNDHEKLICFIAIERPSVFTRPRPFPDIAALYSIASSAVSE
jgi:hypothetical protein